VIGLDDRGLTLGDGLFETLLVLDGALQAAPEHLARMAQGCDVIGLPRPDPDQALRLMQAAITTAGLQTGRAAVRLTLTAGAGGRGLERPPTPAPRLFATAAPSPLPQGPARLAVSAVRRNAGSPASRLKTLSYLDNVLARRQARAAGADEALMLNGAGEVACASAANLFWLQDGRLHTPALECGVLAGVMRAKVMIAAARCGLAVIEAHAGPEALAAAEGLFLTNSLIGVRPVANLDGRPLPATDLVESLRGEVG